MEVRYRKTLKPLYKFEENDIRVHRISAGAKIVFKEDGFLWEIHELQNKEHVICDIRNLIEITNNTYDFVV